MFELLLPTGGPDRHNVLRRRRKPGSQRLLLLSAGFLLLSWCVVETCLTAGNDHQSIGRGGGQRDGTKIPDQTTTWFAGVFVKAHDVGSRRRLPPHMLKGNDYTTENCPLPTSLLALQDGKGFS